MRSAYLLTGDLGRAQDLVQEALVEVARRWTRLRTGNSPPGVVLRHFDDLTERGTAQVLGVSVGTVKGENAATLAWPRDRAPELLDLIGRTR